MSTNITISAIDAYFSVSEFKDIEVNKNNLNHYAPLPANYSEKDYENDIKKLQAFNLRRHLTREGGIEDNLTDEERAERKALKRRIAYYPIQDKEPHKVGDIIETWRRRNVESESDLKRVFNGHLKKRLENPFANIIYFIHDEVKLIQTWIDWIGENNPNWDKRDMLKKYLDLLNTKLKEHAPQQQAEAAIEKPGPTGSAGTTPQQVLAMHFIFEMLKVSATEIDKTHKARFIKFMTGKNDKNIYDSVREPLLTKTKEVRYEDLQSIRIYFENLGLSEIVKMINNELQAPR